MKRSPGRPRKKDPLAPISGRVPSELKQTIADMTKREGSTVAEVMRRLLEQGLAVDSVLARRASSASTN